MHVATTIAQARALFEVLPRPLGFVPTMGALHEGHMELVRRARLDCVAVAASVFVNPLQFGVNEDLERYPRDFGADRERLAAAGVDVVFAPDADAMYPPNFSTRIDPGNLARVFEGAAR
ncbi:MAG TPA: pantoate--beta-alanine ligase, partial [Candidatus Baltobacteraceae bacterium]|nr:pantoate--beta-alanine ligase [Candidatus Baltobacteraceae bacterium]